MFYLLYYANGTIISCVINIINDETVSHDFRLL